VRPLISTGDPRKSVDISRRAELYETSSGLLTITGGKLTTWRRMAKQVVDRMVEREGRDAPCHTAEIPLGMPATDEDMEAPAGLDETALPEGWRRLLAFRYGHAARNVLAVAADGPELTRPIVAGQPDLVAEAVIAARLEQARSVADVLLRRTRLGLLAAPDLRHPGAVMPVARAMGGELGWSETRVRQEAEAWLDAARAEGIDPASAIG
jgi:glycerol-3-phosphate dehydrogenase